MFGQQRHHVKLVLPPKVEEEEVTHAIMAGHGPSNDFRAASDMGLSSSSSDDDERTTATNQEEETDGGGSLSRRSTLVRNKYDAKWDDAYRRLCAFRQRHGHTNISYRCKEDPMLGRWASIQRSHFRRFNASRKTSLTAERIQKLNDVGFDWTVGEQRQIPWESRYLELKQFVRRYGHCQVPMGWHENAPLATWVSTQRQEYQNLRKGRPSRMTTERIGKLNAFNFIWDAKQKRGIELTSPPRKAAPRAAAAGGNDETNDKSIAAANEDSKSAPPSLLSLVRAGALHGGRPPRGAPSEPNAGCARVCTNVIRIKQARNVAALETSASVCGTGSSEAKESAESYHQRLNPAVTCQATTASASQENSRRLFPISFVPQMSQLIQVVPTNIQAYPGYSAAPQVFQVAVPSHHSGVLPHPVTMLSRGAQHAGAALRPIHAGSQAWLPQPGPQSNALPTLICLPQGPNHFNLTPPNATLVPLQQAHPLTLMTGSGLRAAVPTALGATASNFSSMSTPYSTLHLQPMGRLFLAGNGPSLSGEMISAAPTDPCHALPPPSVRRIP